MMLFYTYKAKQAIRRSQLKIQLHSALKFATLEIYINFLLEFEFLYSPNPENMQVF